MEEEKNETTEYTKFIEDFRKILEESVIKNVRTDLSENNYSFIIFKIILMFLIAAIILVSMKITFYSLVISSILYVLSDFVFIETGDWIGTEYNWRWFLLGVYITVALAFFKNLIIKK